MQCKYVFCCEQKHYIIVYHCPLMMDWHYFILLAVAYSELDMSNSALFTYNPHHRKVLLSTQGLLLFSIFFSFRSNEIDPWIRDCYACQMYYVRSKNFIDVFLCCVPEQSKKKVWGQVRPCSAATYPPDVFSYYRCQSNFRRGNVQLTIHSFSLRRHYFMKRNITWFFL